MHARNEYVISGVFASKKEAEAAARSLREAGLGRPELSRVEPGVALSDVIGRGLRGLLSGAVTGALLGVAFEATMLALPGRGPFGTGGWLGAAAIGGIAGGIAGAFLRLGIAQLAAERARRRVAEAAALTLRVRDRFHRERARLLFQQAGAIETRTPLDEEKGPVFVRGFAEVAPRLRSGYRDAARWEEHEPRYRYGWQMANRPDFEGRDWVEAEADVAMEWETRHPGVPWPEVREQVAQGWISAREQRGPR
jgi:hypothetical protein